MTSGPAEYRHPICGGKLHHSFSGHKPVIEHWRCDGCRKRWSKAAAEQDNTFYFDPARNGFVEHGSSTPGAGLMLNTCPGLMSLGSNWPGPGQSEGARGAGESEGNKMSGPYGNLEGVIDLGHRHFAQHQPGGLWFWWHDCPAQEHTSWQWFGQADDGSVGTRHVIRSDEPLDVEGSLLCTLCNDHGFITNGKWVPV